METTFASPSGFPIKEVGGVMFQSPYMETTFASGSVSCAALSSSPSFNLLTWRLLLQGYYEANYGLIHNLFQSPYMETTFASDVYNVLWR